MSKSHPKTPWRRLPNAISLGRLLLTPVLAALAFQDAREAFFLGVLLVGGTDLLDGWLARRFGWTSRLGAQLDSAADVALAMVVILGVFLFHPEVVADRRFMLAALLAVWLVVHVTALLRYRRLASFHTTLARAGMLLFAVFFVVLFTVGRQPWLELLMLGVCIGAGAENLVLVLKRSRPGPS